MNWLSSLGVVFFALAPCQQLLEAQTSGRPANGWMKVPTDVSLPDPVPPALRAARDRDFDRFAPPDPITPANSGRLRVFPGAVPGDAPEIPKVPRRAVVVADIKGHRSVLSASGRSIYTEMTIYVDRVLEDTAGHAAPGAEAVMAVHGGTVRTKDGSVLSFRTQPQRYAVQPNHRYLLVLSYHAEGDYYTHMGDWDLSDGTARANSDFEAERAARGKSAIIGLSEAEVVALLTKQFSNR